MRINRQEVQPLINECREPPAAKIQMEVSTVSTGGRGGVMNRKKRCQENGGRKLTEEPNTKEVMRRTTTAGENKGVELEERRKI